MATIRLPRIRHVRAFIAAVAGTAAISTLSTVAPAGADEVSTPNPGTVQDQNSDHVAIDRAVANADSLQAAVEESRAELGRAEADVSGAEDRIAQIRTQLEQVNGEPGTNEEYVASLEDELRQAGEEKREAESRVALERRELAQNEARLNATQRFAEATFARQQQAAPQEGAASGIQLSQQDSLPTSPNQVDNLDSAASTNAFTVNSEDLTFEDKSQGFTD